MIDAQKTACYPTLRWRPVRIWRRAGSLHAGPCGRSPRGLAAIRVVDGLHSCAPVACSPLCRLGLRYCPHLPFCLACDARLSSVWFFAVVSLLFSAVSRCVLLCVALCTAARLTFRWTTATLPRRCAHSRAWPCASYCARWGTS